MAAAAYNATMAHPPAYVAHEDQRFLIMDAPTDRNLPSYIEECKKHNVRVIVRACEPTYSTQLLNNAGIQVVEMPFADGDPPPDSVVDRWLELCKEQFETHKAEKRSVAVHCVAGLGRAPVLVALSLVELRMEPLDAIAFVRQKRRGAINQRQLQFLESYTPRSAKGCCVVC